MISFLRSRRRERWVIGSDVLRAEGTRLFISCQRDALVLLRELGNDPRGMAALRQVYALAQGGASTFRANDTQVLEILAQRLATGALKVWSVRVPALPMPIGAEESAPVPTPAGPPPPPPPKTPTGWVEIVLVDDGNPPAPLSGVKYRIELPNGDVIEGSLDSHGTARVEGIQEGDVKVTFPELDAAAWTNA